MNAETLNALYFQYSGIDYSGNAPLALYDGVREYVQQMTRNHYLFDPEFVASGIVCEVWRSLPNFKGESLFSTWVHRLTKSSIIDHIRAERRRPNLISEDGEYRIAQPDNTTSLYMDVHDLPTLTEAERELVRQLIACPDYDELAEKLCISTIALRSRFARIKKKCEEQRCVSISADD